MIKASASDDQRGDSALIQRRNRLAGEKGVFVGVTQLGERQNRDQMVVDGL